MAAGGDKKDQRKAKGRRGRPPVGSDSIGRDAIVSAAKRVMRRVPPAQVTRLAIAAEAGVDPNLVRYYFGTVQELISKVVLDQHQQIFDALDERVEPPAPIEWLSFRVDEWLSLFLHNPYHHQFLIQVMYGDLKSDEHAEWTRSLQRSVAYTRAGLEAGVAAGKMRPIDPRMFHLALLGMTEFFANNEQIIRDMFGEDADPASLKEAYQKFLIDLLIFGLKPS